MIKYAIDLPGQKIEFASAAAADAYVAKHNLNVAVYVIDDPTATAEKQKWYPDLTPRQLRQALVLSGISMEMIDALIDKMPAPHNKLAKIEWEYSTAMKRHNPLVEQMAGAMGLTKEQVNTMWELGLTL